MAARENKLEAGDGDVKALRRQLGLWLRERREEVGLTQADLAEHLGLRFHAVVSQVETGVRRVPSDLYKEWALALDIDPLVFAMAVLQYSEPNLYDLIAPHYDGIQIKQNKSKRRNPRTG